VELKHSFSLIFCRILSIQLQHSPSILKDIILKKLIHGLLPVCFDRAKWQLHTTYNAVFHLMWKDEVILSLLCPLNSTVLNPDNW